LPCFRLSHLCGCAAQRQNENVCSWEGVEARRRRASTPKPSRQGGVWGNPVSPCPNRCWERLAPPQAGVRFGRLTAGGETRFPRMFTSGPMRGAHNAAMTMGYLWEGRPLPGPPPLGEGTGRLPAGRGAVRQAHRRWGNPVSPCPNRCWERLAPRRQGDGETRFPHVPTAVGSGWRLPTGRGAVRQAHRLR